MKIISLWEPWSSLLAMSKKRIETRQWSTTYRGPVAIHSTQSGLSMGELIQTCSQKEFYEALMEFEPFAAQMDLSARGKNWIAGVFPHGHIVAVGDLVDCLPTESVGCLPGVFDDWPMLDTPRERAFGNYEPGRYGFVFDNVVRLKEPVRFKSRQGKLLDLDWLTEELVKDQLRA